MFIDPFTMQIFIVVDNLQGADECLVLCGWLQLEQVAESEQQWSMGFEMLPNQRQVVIAASGLNFGAVFAQTIKIALGRQIITDQPACNPIVLFPRQNLRDTIQRGHQPFHFLALSNLDLLKLVFGTLVDSRYAADEHLRQIIAGLGSHPIYQRQHHRIALRQREMLDLCNIQLRRLSREVPYPRDQDPFENLIKIPESIDPRQMVNQNFQIFP
ncbi:hypothetical protein D9M69_500640 [compost metagenome]